MVLSVVFNITEIFERGGKQYQDKTWEALRPEEIHQNWETSGSTGRVDMSNTFSHIQEQLSEHG